MAVFFSRRLDNAIWWYYVIIIVFSLTVLFYRAWTPAAAVYRNSYVLSTPPGTLVTDRWTRVFVEDVLSELYWVVPFTAMFMLTRPGEMWMQAFRAVLLFFLFAYFMVVFGFGIRDWTQANKSDSGNFDNPANDYRWCCVYYNLPGAPCPNVGTDPNDGPCNPGVGVGDLSVNGDFLYKFWFNFVLLLFLVVDFFYMLLVYRQEVFRYMLQLRQKIEARQPLMTTKTFMQ